MLLNNKSSRQRSSGRTGLRKWLSTFVETPDEDSRNRALVFTSVFMGTLIISVILTALLLLSYAALHNGYVGIRLFVASLSLVFLVGVGVLARRRNAYHLAAWFLISFYAVTSLAIVTEWGVNTPFGILFMSLVIILAGILVRAAYALYAALFMSIALVFIQLGINRAIISPDDTWTTQPSSFGDVLGYSAGFLMIALISWLYGRQMERSLRKATQAEKALQAQNANLEDIVKQRTADLEKTRQEELAQMYRFTQFGNLSTGLFHDLANYLTVLSLDINDLHTQHQSSTLDRARETIQYIDTMVENVRDQLSGANVISDFDATLALDKVVHVLQHKAQQAQVSINWKAPAGDYHIHGNVAHFNQVMTTFISNAIDAYEGSTKTTRAVTVRARYTDKHLIITVQDHGKGIPGELRSKLFKPFKTTKEQGMGVGLFIAKQLIESNFSGSITLDPALDHTTFTITIPTKQ